jgi:LacI family transcriptional regulator
LGHRAIAFLGPVAYPHELQQPEAVSKRRQDGYREALSEFKVPFHPEWVFLDSLSPEGGYRIGRRINHSPEITAAFATADILAPGLYRALYEKGKRIPEDFSVVGFDSIRTSGFLIPALTTIGQNARRKGAIAADLWIEQLEEGHQKSIQLPIEFLLRESTSTPPKKALKKG